jgi:ribosomal protein S6
MNYELSFLTTNLPLKDKEKLLNEIEEEIKEMGGNIEEQFSEKKKFAYPVKKQRDGFLGILTLSLDPQKIGKLEKKIASNKNILRAIIERKETVKRAERRKRERAKPEKVFGAKKPVIKKKKAKIEELDQKLEEILK